MKRKNSDDVSNVEFAYNMKYDWQRSVWGCSWITEITQKNQVGDKLLLTRLIPYEMKIFAKLQIPTT